MIMQYSVAQQSHQGGREYNEDRTAIYERDGSVLLVLADGLGGHEGGDVAAQALVDAIGVSFNKATDAQLDKAESFLILSIKYAHHTIHRRAVNQGFDISSPKTTCVVCLIHNGVATWAHAGDSRLYLIHERSIDSITKDHVSQKTTHEVNGPISRCVGGLESPRPEVSKPHKMEFGDTLFLASDGAWHAFEIDDLYDYVDPEHPTLGLDNLLQKLENRNKAPSDNLSIIVLFWGIKQLDIPFVTEYEEPNTIRLLGDSMAKSKATDDANKKFDMKELDTKIDEIESFILDVDDKL